MSITLRIVELLDRLKVQNYFLERNNKTYFTPIKIHFNHNQIEVIADKIFKVNGKPYQMNDLEKNVLKDLDF